MYENTVLFMSSDIRKYLAPLIPCLCLEDFCNLRLQLVKVIKLGKIVIGDTKFFEKRFVELWLYAPN